METVVRLSLAAVRHSEGERTITLCMMIFEGFADPCNGRFQIRRRQGMADDSERQWRAKRLCLFHSARPGSCRNGVACQFSHDLSANLPPPYRPPCKFETYRGACKWGSSCAYSHEHAKDVEPPPPPPPRGQYSWPPRPAAANQARYRRDPWARDDDEDNLLAAFLRRMREADQRGTFSPASGSASGSGSTSQTSHPTNEEEVAALKEAGNTAFKRGDYIEALRKYDAALRVVDADDDDPICITLTSNRATTLYKLDRYRDAIQECDTIISLDRKHFKAHRTRGRAYLAMRRYKEAIKDLGRAQAFAGRTPEADGAREEVIEAIRLEREATERAAREETVEALKAAGNAAFKGGAYTEALSKYDGALRRPEVDKETRTTVESNRAVVLLKLGRFREAVDACDRVLRASPRHLKATRNRGKAYVGLKEWAKALKDFKAAMALLPKAASAEQEALESEIAEVEESERKSDKHYLCTSFRLFATRTSSATHVSSPLADKILGLTRTCTSIEIHAAYKQRALVDHPDKGGTVPAFQRLQMAFSLLSDPKKRKLYDAGVDPDDRIFSRC